MNEQAYNLWLLVIINSLVFIIFAYSFTKPKNIRDWRSFGAFSAFIVALFTEMYGFPLTIYLLSGWLSSKFPDLNLYSHNSGHLWEVLFGWKGDPHFDSFHILSIVFIIAGFSLLASAWDVLYKAQKKNSLAKTGLYAYIRHPQYVGFVVIMFGFLLQWPTIPTLIMFPILVFMYKKLASVEEKEMSKNFGGEYEEYKNKTPPFLPSLSNLTIKIEERK
ncbi:isoprenylcysteine carboxylmethyltransferase family protein [Patescibacteria group bacterium]|nr:isoprenylcysteine carboxylmethyltransferase family protein [Patescibacteria group bacterium]MBU4016613.1 isoprenylcysteine carboxylmethyltransferase family protein [Patescibacteria group bacterium]MBU4098374.1 isoprenylcysteine carboxylmethyltransferase family protein [Patescibacteria group bacterium]